MIEWTLKYIILITGVMIIKRKTTLGAIINLIILLIEIGLWLILNKESFIGVMLILIYVGAIAILFIFVIMMINIKENLLESSIDTLPIISILAIIGDENIVLNKDELTFYKYNIIDIDDINTLSFILMNEYTLYIIEGGMLLLLVMIGVIKMIKRV